MKTKNKPMRPSVRFRHLRREWNPMGTTGKEPIDDQTLIGIVQLACLRAGQVVKAHSGRTADGVLTIDGECWIDQYALARELLNAVGADPLSRNDQSAHYGGICDTGSWYAELTDGRAVFSKGNEQFYVRRATPRRKKKPPKRAAPGHEPRGGRE